MRAVVVNNSQSGLDDLVLIEMKEPEIVQSDDVKVRVSYASINPVDYKLIAHHPQLWQYPYVVGLDIAGEVVDVGNSCQRIKIGDRVAVHGDLSFGGALAEYVVHPEHVLYKVPSQVGLDVAAATPCAGLTAYLALVRKMNIQAGKTILIQGGSGGVGGFAIIIAKALGLHVITTCSVRNFDYVKNLGADVVLDYRNNDVYEEIKKLYPGGVDYILETTNKENLQRDLSILAFNGHIASIVGILDTISITEFVSGFSFHEVALGGAYLSGHYLSQCDLHYMGDELFGILKGLAVTPAIYEYELSNYKQAFTDLQLNANSGKIVISI